jgi:hypothetical protein
MNKERALDDALREGEAPEDPEVASLTRAARDLERSLAVEVPPARRERAMFVQGIAARRHGLSPLRVLVPAVAAAAVLAFVGLLGSRSLPGDDLYAVRAALADLGIVSTPLEDADRRVAEAQDELGRAELLVDVAPGRALRVAVNALVDLGQAARVAERADSEARLDRIRELEKDALDLIEEASENRAAAASGGSSGPSESSGPSDNSGPGGGEGPDDNSGPGGGDDSSGPGGDDSSGPGGGDDHSGSGGGGDDSSGPGSAGDDSSGSGGGDDSSGSGGGGDDSSGSGSSGGSDRSED